MSYPTVCIKRETPKLARHGLFDNPTTAIFLYFSRISFVVTLCPLKLFFEALDFRTGQKAPFPGAKRLIFEETDSNTAEFFDRVPGHAEHFADLLIPALVKRHFVPGIVSLFDRADLTGGQTFAVDEDPSSKLCQQGVIRPACDFHAID